MSETKSLTTDESKKMLNESFMEICKLVSKTNDVDLIYNFFDCLFTPAERKDFAMRWLLVKEIDKGVTQREIAKKFGMSLCKITRGSRELNREDSAFRVMLDLLKSE
ncbi:MAG: transcriptional regulator [Treponema sp.]|nr:transcriptional regulator [Treponema sp.]